MATSHGHGIGCLGKWKHEGHFQWKKNRLYFESYDIKTLLMYHEKLFPKKNLDDWLDEETD